MLVLIGADAGGKKELLAIDDGFRESEQSWHELLVRLRDQNGLVLDPELATGDGALGFWKAARKVWPTVRAQRCRRGLLKKPGLDGAGFEAGVAFLSHADWFPFSRQGAAGAPGRP